jgi:hypothetical protein
MTDDRPEPRRLSTVFLFFIITLPLFSVWFLLRRGYSRQLRVAGFTYAAVSLAPGVVAMASHSTF